MELSDFIPMFSYKNPTGGFHNCGIPEECRMCGCGQGWIFYECTARENMSNDTNLLTNDPFSIREGEYFAKVVVSLKYCTIYCYKDAEDEEPCAEINFIIKMIF